jgi:hypothetical protein
MIRASPPTASVRSADLSEQVGRITVAPMDCAAGWLAVPSEPSAPRFFVRCHDDGRGGVKITALTIVAPDRITSATLRAVPIGRIEAAINADPELLSVALAKDQLDGVLHLLEGAPEIPMGGKSITVTVGDSAAINDSVAAGLSPGDDPAELPLTRPDRTDPTAFYGRVARRYMTLVPKTAKPAPAIAQEAGVPVATARRWINEARRRGLLPAGRPGRA